jgi:hypothetical protein
MVPGSPSIGLLPGIIQQRTCRLLGVYESIGSQGKFPFPLHAELFSHAEVLTVLFGIIPQAEGEGFMPPLSLLINIQI